MFLFLELQRIVRNGNVIIKLLQILFVQFITDFILLVNANMCTYVCMYLYKLERLGQQ